MHKRETAAWLLAAATAVVAFYAIVNAVWGDTTRHFHETYSVQFIIAATLCVVLVLLTANIARIIKPQKHSLVMINNIVFWAALACLVAIGAIAVGSN